MNKAELINAAAEKAGLSKKDTEAAINAALDAIVESLAKEVERRLAGVELPITVAIMGCVVNGPGESKQADVGIAGGGSAGALFRHGILVRRVPKENLLDALMEEIADIAKEMDRTL